MATIGKLLVEIGATIAPMRRALKSAEREFRRSGRRLASIGNELSTTITLPVIGIGAASIKAAADMEKLELALSAVMGDAEMARAEMEKLRKVAEAPGLGFEQAVRGSARLQAVGLSADEARNTLSEFGNAVARSGGGAAELDGVTVALTQIASKGKVFAEEINQLNERVFEIRPAMEAAFGTANSEDLQEMGITAEEFISKVTAELGKLDRVQGGLANSLENARITATQALADIGKVITEEFDVQAIIENVSMAIQDAVRWFSELDPQVKSVGLKVIALTAALGPALKVLGSMKLLLSTLSSTAFLLTGPIGLVVAGIAALVAIVVTAAQKSERFRAHLSGLWEVVKELADIFVGPFVKAVGAAKAALAGEFRKAIQLAGEAIVELNPVTKVKRAGERLGRAYASGFAAQALKDFRKSQDALAAAIEGTKEAFGLGEFAQQEQATSGASSFTLPQLPQQTTGTTTGGGEEVDRSGIIEGLTEPEAIATLDLIPEKINRIRDAVIETVEVAKPKVDEMVMSFQNWADQMRQSAEQGTVTLKEFAQSAVQSIAKVVRAIIVQAVVDFAAKNLSKLAFLGPFALPAATALGAAAGAALNSLVSKIGIPALAEGGLAFGPTSAIVGDNPNARVDPEVIAPLSKLKNMMGGSMMNVTGTIRADGQDLLVVIDNAQNRRTRVRGF